MKFKFGDRVSVSAEARMEYDDLGKRHLVRDKYVAPTIGRICGLRKRQLGEYKPGNPDTGYPYDEFSAPYLKITGIIELWEIKIGYLNKPIQAHEDDITKLGGNYDIPILSMKPVTIQHDEQYYKDYKI